MSGDWRRFDLDTPKDAVDRAVEANVTACVEAAFEQLIDFDLTDAQIEHILQHVETTTRQMARVAFAKGFASLVH